MKFSPMARNFPLPWYLGLKMIVPLTILQNLIKNAMHLGNKLPVAICSVVVYSSKLSLLLESLYFQGNSVSSLIFSESKE